MGMTAVLASIFSVKYAIVTWLCIKTQTLPQLHFPPPLTMTPTFYPIHGHIHFVLLKVIDQIQLQTLTPPLRPLFPLPPYLVIRPMPRYKSFPSRTLPLKLPDVAAARAMQGTSAISYY